MRLATASMPGLMSTPETDPLGPTRAATVMDRHAKGYTDEQIKLLSEYIGSLD